MSYLEIKKEIVDHRKHTVKVKLACAEQFCVDRVGDDTVTAEILPFDEADAKIFA